MATCCCPGKASDVSESRCPSSGSAGVAVDLQTVKALLTDTALRRLNVAKHRFCPDPTCDVVYFDVTGRTFGTGDVRVAVWQKQPFGRRPICYCFGESEASIQMELEDAGRSLAVERVREYIRAGRCACGVRNPRGSCCLADVAAAVKRVESAWTDRLNVRMESEDVHAAGSRPRHR